MRMIFNVWDIPRTPQLGQEEEVGKMLDRYVSRMAEEIQASVGWIPMTIRTNSDDAVRDLLATLGYYLRTENLDLDHPMTLKLFYFTSYSMARKHRAVRGAVGRLIRVFNLVTSSSRAWHTLLLNAQRISEPGHGKLRFY